MATERGIKGIIAAGGLGTRLNEQEPREGFASHRLGEYVQRWVRWAWGWVEIAFV